MSKTNNGMTEDSIKGISKVIVGGVFVALFSASVSFGLAVGGDVKAALTEINNLKATDNRILDDINEEKQRAERRMQVVSGLMESVLKQNQEFIQLLRVQNELMMQQQKFYQNQINVP